MTSHARGKGVPVSFETTRCSFPTETLVGLRFGDFDGIAGANTIPGIVQNLIPGVTYNIDTRYASYQSTTKPYGSITVKVNAPAGYLVYLNGSLTLNHLTDGGTVTTGSITSVPYHRMGTIRLEKRSKLIAGEDVFELNDDFNWSVSIGSLINGDSAGMLDFINGDFSSSFIDVSNLSLMDANNPEVSVTKSSGKIQSIETANNKTVVTDLGSSTGYNLVIYEKSGGSWIEYKRWQVRKDTSVTSGFAATMDVITGTRTSRRRMVQNANKTQWYVEYGQVVSGAFQVERKVVTSYNSSTRTYRVEYYKKTGGSYARDHIIEKDYFDTSYGEEKVSEYRKIKNDGTSDTISYWERYHYYLGSSLNYRGELKSKENSLGQWTYYEYFGNNEDGYGLKKSYTPKTEVASDLPSSFGDDFDGRITTYERVGLDYMDFYGTAYAQETTEGSNTYSNTKGTFTYVSSSSNPKYAKFETRDFVNPNQTSGSVISRKHVYSIFNTKDWSRYLWNRSRYQEGPDGSAQSFVYQRGSYNASTRAFTPSDSGTDWRQVTLTGFSSARSGFTSKKITTYGSGVHNTCPTLYVVSSKSTVTEKIYTKGRLACERVLLYTGSGYEEIGWTKYTYATGGYLTKKESSNGALWEGTYTNGLLTQSKNEQGIIIKYTYDGLGRLIKTHQPSVTYNGESVPGATIQTTYDSVGHVIAQKQLGDSENLTTSKTYDTAGYLTEETLSCGTHINYSYAIDANGYYVKTTHNQTLNTSVAEHYYADGSLYCVTGDVVPEYYKYGFDNGLPYVTKLIGSASSVRTQTVIKDWLGNTVETILPENNSNFTLSYINEYDLSTGRLINSTTPGMADTLYTYNSLGDLQLKGQDINGDGELTPASTDILVKYETNNVKDSTGWWVEQKTYGYATMNSSAKTLLTQSHTRLSGFSGGKVSETQQWGQGGSGKAPMVRQWSVLNRSAQTVTTYAQTSGVSTNSFSVNAGGRDVYSKAANGVVSEVTYDSLGRVECQESAGTWQRFEYFHGTTVRSSDYGPYGGDEIRTALYTYSGGSGSACGRLVRQADAWGYTTRYEYNNRGQVIRKWGSKVNPESYIYNDFGEMTDMYSYRSGKTVDTNTWGEASFGNAGHTHWTYDARTGLPMTQTDAGNHITRYGYDAYNRQQYILQPRIMGSGYLYQWLTYDTSGQVISEKYRKTASTSAGPNITSDSSTGYGEDAVYTYDRLGRCIKIADAESSNRAFNYNASTGLLSSEVTNSTPIGLLSNTYSYETATRRASSLTSRRESAILHKETMGYNASTGQISSIARTDVASYAYGWNSTNGAISTITGGSFKRTYGYGDSRGLLTQVSNKYGSTNLQTDTLVYDALKQINAKVETGSLYGRYSGDAIHSSGTYDSRSQLTSWKSYTGSSGTTALAGRNWTYSYDRSGNRTTSQQGAAKNTYTSNGLNQYTQVVNNGVHSVAGFAASSANVIVNGNTPDNRQEDYFYDETAAQTISTTLSTKDRIVAAIPGGGVSNKDIVSVLYKEYWKIKSTNPYTYDVNGNLTHDPVWRYDYDAKNQLAHMISLKPAANGRHIELWFKYDYMGRRFYKKSIYRGETTEIYYLYDGWNLVAELDSSGAVLRDYTYGVDPSGGAGAGALLGMTNHIGSTVHYNYLQNSHGDVAGLVRTNGSLAAAYEYDPYGKQVRAEDTASTGNPFGYSGQYTDKETGLVYYGKRYYDPNMGRFINKDPIGLSGGHNLYAFVGNNPMNSWDLKGMAVVTNMDDYKGNDILLLDPYEVNGNNQIDYMMSEWSAFLNYIQYMPYSEYDDILQAYAVGLPGYPSSGAANSSNKKPSKEEPEKKKKCKSASNGSIIGDRTSLSGGFILGGNGSLDVLYDQNTSDTKAFLTVGLGLTIPGINLANGPVVTSAKSFDDYTGLSAGGSLGGYAIPIGPGAEMQISIGFNSVKTISPMLIGGGSGGPTADATISYTVNVTLFYNAYQNTKSAVDSFINDVQNYFENDPSKYNPFGPTEEEYDRNERNWCEDE